MKLDSLIFVLNNSLVTKIKKLVGRKIGFQLKSNLESNWIWALEFLHSIIHLA